MKTLLLLAVGAMVASPAFGADILEAAPQQAKLLKEDGNIRVIEYTSKKGDKIPLHSHPRHVVYILKAGKTQFTLADGTKPKPGDVKDGQALINPPITHSQETLEDTHAILIEIKE
jgi:beta-alanine degradation protein BauB